MGIFLPLLLTFLNIKNTVITFPSRNEIFFLEPFIQSEVSQKETIKYCILTHIYGI